MKRLTISFFVLFIIIPATKAQDKTKIYGGKHYQQFLGCFDCDPETSNSIWSSFTEYGSSHNSKSIWNENGKYGSVTSNFSPYNSKAKYPPRVVDANGRVLGYLTVNKDNPNRLQGTIADLICFSRDTVLRDGVEKYGEQFGKTP